MTGHRGIILLEGSDSSGKSTLAHHFVERYGARYLHPVIRKQIYRWHLGALRYALRLADAELVVLDRLWHSEQAYGTAFHDAPRGPPQYTIAARCFDRVLLRNAVTVLCAPRDMRRQERRWHDGRKAGKHEHFDRVREVIQLYADLRFGNVAHPGDGYLDQLIRFGDYTKRSDVMVYDVDEDGPEMDVFAERILLRLQLLRSTQWQPGLISRNQNYVGHLAAAKSLVVGEATPAGYPPGWPKWPWMWNDDPLTGATLLNQALQKIAHREETAVWTNSHDFGDLPGLLRICTDRGIRVITLGGRPVHRVRKLGFQVRTELHKPQQDRRFAPYEHEIFARELGEALR